MSLKEEIKYVKDELSSDEKLLENAFKLERFYKKHKIKIWLVLIVLVTGVGGKYISDAYGAYRLNRANEALLALQQNGENPQALAELKKYNPNLYELYRYSVADRQKNPGKTDIPKNELLKDLTAYHEAVSSSRPGDSKYYRDFSIVEKAYTALKNGEKEKARTLLITIGENSPLSKIARLMMHETIN